MEEKQIPRWGTKVKPHIEFCIKTLKMQFQTVHEMFIGMNSDSFSGDPKNKIAAVEKAIWNAYIQVCKLFNCNNLIMMILGYLSFMLLFIVAFAVDFFCYFFYYLLLFYLLFAVILLVSCYYFLVLFSIVFTIYYYLLLCLLLLLVFSSLFFSSLLFSPPFLQPNMALVLNTKLAKPSGISTLHIVKYLFIFLNFFFYKPKTTKIFVKRLVHELGFERKSHMCFFQFL